MAGSNPDALIFKINYDHHFNIGIYINIYNTKCLHGAIVQQPILQQLRVGSRPTHGKKLEVLIYSLGAHEGALGIIATGLPIYFKQFLICREFASFGS